eukprot:gene7593-9337_t
MDSFFNISKSIVFGFATLSVVSPQTQQSTPPTLNETSKSGKKTKIVIVGGGTGGLSVGAQLQKSFKEKGDIVIIEPSDKHYYQPLWTLVGGGIFTKDKSVRDEKDYIPKGTSWEKDSVVEFKPKDNKVITKDGKSIEYDYLVVATGLTIYWEKVKGLKETLGKNGVTSNYSFESVDKTFEFIKNLKSGVAIFTFPNTGIKCGGAPQKIMWLADDYFRKHGVRDSINIQFNTAGVSMFAVKKYSDALDLLAKERGVTQNFKHNLIEIKGDSKEAVFETPEGKKVVKYDMIHVTPPMGPSDVIKNSPLADPATGFVNVNKETLQHVEYKNVFALGDCTNLPTSKTAAAITKQAPCLVANLISHKNGDTMEAKYDGYTSCPITTSYSKLILAEFKYGNEVDETFPLDQSKERYAPMLMKKYLFPFAYWNFLTRGQCIYIDVKVFGLSKIEKDELESILNHIEKTDFPVLLNPEIRDIKLIQQKFIYQVSEITTTPFSNLKNAITKYIKPGYGNNIVPFDIVDDVIYNDCKSENPLSYSIYILNFDISDSYSYSQLNQSQFTSSTTTSKNVNNDDDEEKPKKVTFSDTNQSCKTKIWQGKAPSLNGINKGEGRYVWIDIGADSPLYGPKTKGTGSVLPEDFPQKSNSMTTKLYSISTFISQTTKQLLSPPIYWFPKLFEYQNIEIRLVMIHDHKLGKLEESENFDWEMIQNQIQKIPLLPRHKITFSKTEISLLDNEYVSQIKQSSLKTHHSGTKGVQQYLDSKELHLWFKKHLLKLVPERKNKGKGEVEPYVVPIFLFDISYKDILLLDRAYQAVPFQDMVIAIQTQSDHIRVDFKCDRQLYIDSTDSTRPVLASLLQTIWGITPTHFNLPKNSKTIDNSYLWSMGYNPFSVFSTQKEISFSQADTGFRNHVYFSIVNALSPLNHVMDEIDKDESLTGYNGDQLIMSQIQELQQSIQKSLNEVGQHISFHKDQEASYQISKIQDSSSNLTSLFFENRKNKFPYLECKPPTFLWVEVLCASGTVLMTIYLSYFLFKRFKK